MKTSKVKGKVISNDGEGALIRFNDGAEKLFTRDTESRKEFKKCFSIGEEIEVEKLHTGNIDTREKLFESVKELFQIGPGSVVFGALYYPLKHIENKTIGVLIGQALSVGDMMVFCTEKCTRPDGKGKGFALLYSDDSNQCFSFSEKDLDEVLGLLQTASNLSRSARA